MTNVQNCFTEAAGFHGMRGLGPGRISQFQADSSFRKAARTTRKKRLHCKGPSAVGSEKNRSGGGGGGVQLFPLFWKYVPEDEKTIVPNKPKRHLFFSRLLLLLGHGGGSGARRPRVFLGIEGM